ncbi:hypothetical protein C8Q73DRAFT_779911 [Cubamyces lactineus]|nr:hypothetical protein C8Q73DRAFT_779911 [Cubamyces lactineus]
MAEECCICLTVPLPKIWVMHLAVNTAINGVLKRNGTRSPGYMPCDIPDLTRKIPAAEVQAHPHPLGTDVANRMPSLSTEQLASELEQVKKDKMYLQERLKTFEKRHHNERRQLGRAVRAAAKLREKLKSCRVSEKRALKMRESSRIAAVRANERAQRDVVTVLGRMADERDTLQSNLQSCRSKIRALEKQCARFPLILETRIAKAKVAPTVFRLKRKGIYTTEARMLARLLISSGCAQEKVGRLVQQFGRIFGCHVKEQMSAHTIRRAVFEGCIASDIQIGHEIATSSSVTISGDGTTHRHVNYEARHMVVRAPETYSSESSESPVEGTDPLQAVPKNRLIGVESSVDHTSETQSRGWKSKLADITSKFNNSPFAKRAGQTLSIEECGRKLAGMGGDHAADQFKTTDLLAAWKRDMTYLVLAREHLEASSPALGTLVADAGAAAIQSVGGEDAWMVLSDEERVAITAEEIERARMMLGKSLLEALPEAEQRPLDLFLRLGCAMHKDLNSVKGGNAAMMAEWANLGVPPPILLANKQNASTLRDIDVDAIVGASSLILHEELNPAELRALESSARGGVKTASLAGAIFNHKDDKKGQHDAYTSYFRELVGQPLRFPDTSNTRYQSYCAAAAELLVHREEYLGFLEVVRDQKQRPGFNHMEENVYNALQDVPTLTELAALTLYAQAITQPYIRVARRHQNGLLLGPLHHRLKTHIQSLIDNPDLLLSAGATFHTASLDGLDWEHPEAVSTVLKMAPSLPYLKPIFVAFLRGALTTWTRFTQEFAPGGAIDRASDAERDAAWIFPTNDHNEGALGRFRVWARSHPNGTEAYYNAQARVSHNQTEEFMAVHLTSEDDQKYLRAAARELDSSGHAAERRRERVRHAVQTAARAARERQERMRKAAEAQAKVDATVLILEADLLVGLTKDKLEEQLEVYRKRLGDKEVPLKSKIPKKLEKLEALQGALSRYQSRRAQGCSDTDSD